MLYAVPVATQGGASPVRDSRAAIQLQLTAWANYQSRADVKIRPSVTVLISVKIVARVLSNTAVQWLLQLMKPQK